jgi:hypothetical protein
MRTVSLTKMDLMRRVSIELALIEAVQISRQHPEKVYWLHAVPCPLCHRHAAAICCSTSRGSVMPGQHPKYVMATIVNGEVIPRGPIGRQ